MTRLIRFFFKLGYLIDIRYSMNNLCISLLIGPKCPNPDAMVLISTCFQQQYGRESSSSLQHDSSIKSDLNNPNDKGCHEYYVVLF